MEIINTYLGQVLHLKMPHFQDERGGFSKAFSKTEMLETFDIKQANYVTTHEANTLRGLHFQDEPFREAKLFRVLRGKANFVFFNVLASSDHYQKSASVVLESGAECVLIPRGYATGYEVLESNTEVLYFSDNDYMPDFEKGVLWSDAAVKHHWQSDTPILSEKDQKWTAWQHS